MNMAHAIKITSLLATLMLLAHGLNPSDNPKGFTTKYSEQRFYRNTSRTLPITQQPTVSSQQNFNPCKKIERGINRIQAGALSQPKV